MKTRITKIGQKSALNQMIRELFVQKYGWLMMLSAASAAAVYIHIGLLEFASGDYISHYSSWLDSVRTQGIISAPSDYPAGFDWIMWFAVRFTSGDCGGLKWSVLPFDFLAAAAAFGIVYILAGEKNRAALAYCLILMLPSVVLNTSYWGQVDIIYVSLVLAAFFLLLCSEIKAGNIKSRSEVYIICGGGGTSCLA